MRILLITHSLLRQHIAFYRVQPLPKKERKTSLGTSRLLVIFFLNPQLNSVWGFLAAGVCVGVFLPLLNLFYADVSPSAFFNLVSYLTCFVPTCTDVLQIIHTTKRCHCSTVKGQTGPVLKIHLHIYTPRKGKKKKGSFYSHDYSFAEWFYLKLLVKGKLSDVNRHKTFNDYLREILLGAFLSIHPSVFCNAYPIQVR